MSSNMSLGVNLLFNLVKQTASALKDTDYDIEIAETHHKHKKDAPSGTALSLGEYAAEGRKTKLNKSKVFSSAPTTMSSFSTNSIGVSISRSSPNSNESLSPVCGCISCSSLMQLFITNLL